MVDAGCFQFKSLFLCGYTKTKSFDCDKCDCHDGRSKLTCFILLFIYLILCLFVIHLYSLSILFYPKLV